MADNTGNKDDAVKGTTAVAGQDEQEAIKLPVATTPVDNAKKGKKGKKAEAKKPKVPYSKLYRFADRTDAVLMVLGIIGAMANGVILPSFAIIFGEMMDSFQQNNFLDDVEDFALYFFLLGLASFVLSYCQVAFFIAAEERQVAKLRVAYFKALQVQEMGWFDVHKPGDIIGRISEDAMAFGHGIGEKVSNTVQNLTTFVAGFIVGFIYGPLLTLVILAFLPPLVFSAGFIKKYTEAMEARSAEAYGKAGAAATETLANIRTVQAFNGVEHEVGRYASRLDETQRIGIKKGNAMGFSVGLLWFFMMVSYGVGLKFGAYLIGDDREEMPVLCGGPVPNEDECFTGGRVLQVFFAVIMGAFSVGQVGPNFETIGNAQGAAVGLFEVIDRKSKIDPTEDTGDKPDPATLRGTIEFRNVTFAYPSRPNEPILQNFSLSIPAGKTVALVGHSGCGKSTLMQLVQRFYDPQEGQVLLDGKDVKEYNLRWLRDRIGVVQQEPVLFNTTITENIALGATESQGSISDEDVVKAAKLANAHEFIKEKEDKYATIVGARGGQLSGGQKQRVAIARALIRHPRLLLLDEATSALDTQSEQKVQEALDKVIQSGTHMTVMVIAHRLSTITDADQIVVMDKGTIVETGKHDELMAKGDSGVYYQLRKEQQVHDAEDELYEGEGVDKRDSAPVRRRSSAGSGREADVEEEEDPTKEPSKEDLHNDLEYETKRCLCCNRRVLKDTVPQSRVWAMQKPEMPFIMISLLACIINGCLMPSFALLFTDMIALFYTPDPQKLEDDSNLFVGLFFGLAGVACLASVVQFWGFNFVGERLTRRVRVKVYKALLRQEPGFFDEQSNTVGRLTARLSTDAAILHAASGQGLGLFLQNIVAITFALIVAFISSWQLTLVVLACAPLLLLAGKMQMAMFTGMQASSAKYFKNASHLATEMVTNVRTVTSLNLQPYFDRKFKEALGDTSAVGWKKGSIGGVSFGISQFFMLGAYGLCFYVGGLLIENGDTNFDDMVRVFFAIAMAAIGSGQASQMAADQGGANAAKISLFRILDRKSKADPLSKEGGKAENLRGAIEFRNLRFSYPTRPDLQVLKGLTLTAEPGETVALVGASGCGKSTLVQLLQRFYDPEEGEVLIDGQDARSLNLDWLRSNMGIVGQEPLLFNDSVEYNIKYGDPHHKMAWDTGVTVEGDLQASSANLDEERSEGKQEPGTEPADVAVEVQGTDPEVVKAATMSNAHGFITGFGAGYRTNVGEGGGQLSGGQKQRVAIARALIRNPRILLLDEATSALDTKSEKVVQQALDELLADRSTTRTTFIVAHRLSTIRNADKIVYLENGTVAEIGTHDELIAKEGGHYRALATAQDRGMTASKQQPESK